MILRGGLFIKTVVTPHINRLLVANDYARMISLEARWIAIGISKSECEQLLPCAVWIAKFPGTKYSETIMKRLHELSCRS